MVDTRYLVNNMIKVAVALVLSKRKPAVIEKFTKHHANPVHLGSVAADFQAALVASSSKPKKLGICFC